MPKSCVRKEMYLIYYLGEQWIHKHIKKINLSKMRYDLLGGWGLRQRGYKLVKKKKNNNNHHHQLNAYYELHNVLADLNTFT